MEYLKTHKEISLLLGIVIVFLIAGFNLFHDQPPSSKFTKAGASVLSSYTSSGAGRCNIPTYEEYYGRPFSPAPSEDDVAKQ